MLFWWSRIGRGNCCVFFICFSTADPNHQCTESQIFPFESFGSSGFELSKPQHLGVSHGVSLKIVYPYTQWFCWSLSLLNGYNWEYTKPKWTFHEFPGAHKSERATALPSWGSNSKDLTTKSTNSRDSPVDSLPDSSFGVKAAVVPNVLQGPLETAGDCRNRRSMEKPWRNHEEHKSRRWPP